MSRIASALSRRRLAAAAPTTSMAHFVGERGDNTLAPSYFTLSTWSLTTLVSSASHPRCFEIESRDCDDAGESDQKLTSLARGRQALESWSLEMTSASETVPTKGDDDDDDVEPATASENDDREGGVHTGSSSSSSSIAHSPRQSNTGETCLNRYDTLRCYLKVLHGIMKEEEIVFVKSHLPPSVSLCREVMKLERLRTCMDTIVIDTMRQFPSGVDDAGASCRYSHAVSLAEIVSAVCREMIEWTVLAVRAIRQEVEHAGPYSSHDIGRQTWNSVTRALGCLAPGRNHVEVSTVSRLRLEVMRLLVSMLAHECHVPSAEVLEDIFLLTSPSTSTTTTTATTWTNSWNSEADAWCIALTTARQFQVEMPASHARRAIEFLKTRRFFPTARWGDDGAAVDDHQGDAASEVDDESGVAPGGNTTTGMGAVHDAVLSLMVRQFILPMSATVPSTPSAATTTTRAATDGDVVTDTTKQRTSFVVNQESFEWIHQTYSSCKGCKQISTVLRLWQDLGLSSNEGTPPDKRSETEKEGVEDVSTTKEVRVNQEEEEERQRIRYRLCLLRLYSNGTALLQIGHLVDSCIDWNVRLHEEGVAAIVADTMASLRDLATQERCSSSEMGIQKQKAFVMHRVHEGLRLSMKSFVKALKYGDAVAFYEAHPDMGITWEVGCCFAKLGRLDDSLRALQQFLCAVGPKFGAKGVPSYIKQQILAVLREVGRNTAQGQSQSVSITEFHALQDAFKASLKQSSSVTTTPTVIAEIRRLLLLEPVEAIRHSPPDAAVMCSSNHWRELLSLHRHGAFRGLSATSVLKALVDGAVTTTFAAPPTMSPTSGAAQRQVQQQKLSSAVFVMRLLRLASLCGTDVSRRYDLMASIVTDRRVGVSSESLRCAFRAWKGMHEAITSAIMIEEGELEDSKRWHHARRCGEKAIAVLLDFVAAMDKSYPRLNVWYHAIHWAMTSSGMSDALALPLLKCCVAKVGDDVGLYVLDSLSEAVASELHAMCSQKQREQQTISDDECESDNDTAVSGQDAASLFALVSVSLEQKQSYRDKEGPWECLHCHTRCPAQAKSCPVCSALRLHVWQCVKCRGFSPSTHSESCLVCNHPRDADDATVTKLALRAWTCKSCRKQNEATQIFFCSSCSSTSYAAFRSQAMVSPFDCQTCGHHNPLGILEPWCGACGTPHTVAVAAGSARLWKCHECFQRNPWTTMRCRDCGASRATTSSPRTGAAAVVEEAWEQRVCDDCGRSSAPWVDQCSWCNTPWLAGGGGGDSNDVEGAEDDMKSVVGSTSIQTPALRRRQDGVSGGSSISTVRPNECSQCHQVLYPCSSSLCLSCGTKTTNDKNAIEANNDNDAAASSFVGWVCLRSACFEFNAPHVDRCGKCNASRGLATTITPHANIFKYQPSEMSFMDHHEDRDDNALEQENIYPTGDSQQQNKLQAPDALHPTAVLIPRSSGGGHHGEGGGGVGGSCSVCEEPISDENLTKICPVCCHSAWSIKDVHAELALWLHLSISLSMMMSDHRVASHSSSSVVLIEKGKPPVDYETIFNILGITADVLTLAREEQLPWRGRDMSNMRCTEDSRVPVHEPEGMTHGGLQLVSKLLLEVVEHVIRQQQVRDEQYRVRWLLIALRLVDVVNNSTCFDELSFDVVSKVALCVWRLDKQDSNPERRDRVIDEKEAASNEEEDVDDCIQAFLDPLRIEYLVSMKLSTMALVAACQRCRGCLAKVDRCSCGTTGVCGGSRGEHVRSSAATTRNDDGDDDGHVLGTMGQKDHQRSPTTLVANRNSSRSRQGERSAASPATTTTRTATHPRMSLAPNTTMRKR